MFKWILGVWFGLGIAAAVYVFIADDPKDELRRKLARRRRQLHLQVINGSRRW